jgi:hypothetical protein
MTKRDRDYYIDMTINYVIDMLKRREYNDWPRQTRIHA